VEAVAVLGAGRRHIVDSRIRAVEDTGPSALLGIRRAAEAGDTGVLVAVGTAGAGIVGVGTACGQVGLQVDREWVR